MRYRVLFLIAAWFLWVSTASDGQRDSGYRIGPKDQLSISVFEDPDLGGERRVSENGTISFPPLGDIPVEGLTAPELEVRLKQILEKDLYQRATVNIQVLEFRSKPISVIGAVNRPGDLAFSGRWTLLEALTAAGGLSVNHGSLIYVLRRAENGLADQVEISIEDLMVRGDPRVNIPIFANDLINVSGAVERTVYCLGEVGQPGALVFKSGERFTLLAAIARAGGLTDRAASKITIKRVDSVSGREEEIDVDYKRIVAGKKPDVKLVQGDVVLVKESFF